MNNIKCIRYNLIILLLLVFLKDSESDSNEDPNILKVVKRNLLRREEEYLKNQPLSENLKNFIKRYKRKSSNFKGKGGKYEGNERSVKHIVPQRSADEADTTVETVTTIGTIIPSSIPESTLTNLSSITNSTSNTSLSTTETFNSSTVNCKDDKSSNEDEDYELPSDVTSTQKKELLGKVMKDVQELIRYESAAKTSEGEASLCNVTGDWDSFAGGMQIRIFKRLHPENPFVRIVSREPMMTGFLTESEWNVTAHVPFKHSSLIAITAVSTKGKKIAMFLGECRICEGSESITGHWMIRRRSKNCKDREEANTFISDVMRKNNVRKLRKEHLNTVVTTTENLDNILTV